ncbi:MAG: hypothetical protein JST27_04855 [Bacteroidetes bacterium]|nr:hypothetical protein [Bacteroidota bacterium]
MPHYFYETIRARVRNPYLPVDISTRLPLRLTRIVGIQCKYISGIERIIPRITADIIPRIGWFTLSVNNMKRPLGVFDVRYERPWIDSNDDYQDLDVPIQGGSMITGTYNNELQYPYGASSTSGTTQGATGGTVVVSGGGGGGDIILYGGDGSGSGVNVQYDGVFLQSNKVSPIDIVIVNPASAANYDGYIVAICLKCIGDTTLK